MRILIILILIINVSKSKDLIGTSNDNISQIIELVAGNSMDVVTTRNKSIRELGTLEYEPDPNMIILSGATSVYFYASEEFDNWVLDIPAKNKIDLSDFIEDERKIFLSDSNFANFWWLDPKIVLDILPKIADTLSALIPEKAASFSSNLNSSLNKISLLDGYINGILKEKSVSPIYEEFPVLMYFAESYNLPYSDFLYYQYGDRLNSFNSGIIESLEISGTEEFLTHQKAIDSTLKELSLKLKFQIIPINTFPEDDEDYYSMMKRIAHNIKRVYSN